METKNDLTPDIAQKMAIKLMDAMVDIHRGLEELDTASKALSDGVDPITQRSNIESFAMMCDSAAGAFFKAHSVLRQAASMGEGLRVKAYEASRR
jgi:hypothetical protein